MPATTTAMASLLLTGGLPAAVVDFLEQVVVLVNLGIVRIQLERLLVGLARLLELALVFVGDGEVVVSCGVGRIQFDGLLPAVDRLAPQPTLRDADPEFHLGPRVAARVGE